MFLFSGEEIANFRSRRDCGIIGSLQKNTAEIMRRDMNVPKTGVANWKLYYYCPKHSVELVFDLDKPFSHFCPACGQALTGEPYDSAWWGYMNQKNFKWTYELSLLYLLTEDGKYAAKARAILMEYAKYYISYAEHGDIPYNGPGKAEAQTLNEAVFLRSFAYAADILESYLSDDDKVYLRENMFVPGGEFLMEHRTNQIHNHEVIIDSAIGVLGLLTDNQRLISFAVDEPYGLRYQLEHAVLEDALWFEGTLNYHLFALENFLYFEKFARFTKYAGLDLEKYSRMFGRVRSLLTPQKKLPLINDIVHAHGAIDHYDVFEFGYKLCPQPDIAAIINFMYLDKPRDSAEAFFFGVPELPTAEDIALTNYHNADGSGLTVLRGEKERYLLVKHSPYGGEHDHYDRLGISFSAFGAKLCSDFGTTGYGASLHYDYYKNTGAHNTVVIGEENQPPQNCAVYSYNEYPGRIELDCGVEWTPGFVMPDSFTIKAWDDECYTGVKMRRKIIWMEDYFIEAFRVTGVKDRSIDWVLHVCGELLPDNLKSEPVGSFSAKKPFKYLHDTTKLEASGEVIKHSFKIDDGGFNLFSLVNGTQIYRAMGPDCPSVSDVNYIINRGFGDDALFVNVFEAFDASPVVVDVDIKPKTGGALVKITGKRAQAFDIEI